MVVYPQGALGGFIDKPRLNKLLAHVGMMTNWQEIDARITREDTVHFINAAVSATSQEEFYDSAGRQSLSLSFLHEYMRINYPLVYVKCLAAGINHHNQGRIIINVMYNGLNSEAYQRHRSEIYDDILGALILMPPQRAMKILMVLVRRRVNNRTMRRLIHDFLMARPDPVFDAVKYRNKVKILARHAHLKLSELPSRGTEYNEFLFEPKRQRKFETPLFEKYRAAHYAQDAVYDLPYTIAVGLAAKHKIPAEIFMDRIKPQLTKAENERLGETAKRAGVDIGHDLSRMDLTRLAIYTLSLKMTERTERAEEIKNAFRIAAKRIAESQPLALPKTAAVLDRSYSTSGSQEKRRRPLALSLGVHYLLRQVCEASGAKDMYKDFWTLETPDPHLVTAKGQSDLITPLLAALKWGAKQIIIVSDGYENAPPFAVRQFMHVYHKNIASKFDLKDQVSFVHLNPVFDADAFNLRPLSPDIVTMGLRNAEDIFTPLNFARFAAGHADIKALEIYLDQAMHDMMSVAREKRASNQMGWDHNG